MRISMAQGACGAALACATALVPAPIVRAGDAGTTYVLDDSYYFYGCFDPCLCPLGVVEMTGTFRLVPITLAGTYELYAVEDVSWTAGGEVTITGTGTYERFQEFAALHRLQLDVSVSGGEVMHYDDGLVVGGQEFPVIVAGASLYDYFCFDQGFWIRAVPKAQPCPGDLDGDGEVGFGDLLAVLSAWGPCDACPEDIDANGNVGFSDVLLVLATWGSC
jgi:hypothetical protein